jgi:tetratricopeptide (TPR) repeat protein
MKKSKIVLKYILQINKSYGIDINEENYKELLLNQMLEKKDLWEYLKRYMETNNTVISLEWGCLMYIFIKSFEEKDVYYIEKFYKKLLLYPENFILESWIGEFYYRYYADFFKARDKYLKALELKPMDAECHHNLALVYFYLGIPDKIIEHNEKAIMYCQNSNTPYEVKARSLFNIATLYINLYDNVSEGKKLIKQALKEMPDYPQAKQALKQIERSYLWKKN